MKATIALVAALLLAGCDDARIARPYDQGNAVEVNETFDDGTAK